MLPLRKLLGQPPHGCDQEFGEMRFGPIVTAIAVAAFLYAWIIERDWLLAVAGAQETSSEQTQAGTGSDVAFRPISVVAERSVAQEVDSGIILTGRTEAARRVDVRAETSGLVVSEPLRRGTFVEEGEVLCKLDPGTREVELTEAKARLDEAQANNNAAENLVQKGFTSETAAISRKAQLESAQAAVERAQKELDRLTILAPFDGLLESDSAELGALLQAGSPCATVIDLDPMKLVGYVPERQVSRLAVGTRAGGRLVTGEEVLGDVTFISRSADELTRTFRVEVTVDNANLDISDGTTVEIGIALAGRKAHFLPQSALTLDDNGRLGIRIAQGDVARFMPVEIVRDTSEGVWLTGLPEEVDVIVVGQEYVVDGRAIDVSMREVTQ